MLLSNRTDNHPHHYNSWIIHQLQLFEVLPILRRVKKEKGGKKANLVSNIVYFQPKLPYIYSKPKKETGLRREGVTKFIPRGKYGLLDRHFPSCVLHIEELLDLAIVLDDEGRYCVGHVVQMSESELLDRLNGDEHKLELLIAVFVEDGLEVGSSAPRWRAPDRSSFDRGCID